MSVQGEGSSPAGQLLVWDTSPLHHAIKAGRVDTLADLAAECRGLPRRNVTTAAVIEELRHYDLDISGLGWLEVQHVDGLAELTALVRWMERVSGQKSNHGEATVLAWADVHGGVAVIDDLDARKAGRAGGLTVWGVLRVIAEGVQDSRVTEYVASTLVDALLASGARYPCGHGGFIEWARKKRTAVRPRPSPSSALLPHAHGPCQTHPIRSKTVRAHMNGDGRYLRDNEPR